MTLTYFIPKDVSLDHLVKVVSARFTLYKVTIFLFPFHPLFLWKQLTLDHQLFLKEDGNCICFLLTSVLNLKATLMVQMVKNLPIIWETSAWSLGWEDPLEEGCNPLQYSCLENPHGQRSLVGYSPWGHKESDTTEWLRRAQHSTNPKE